MFPYFWIWLRSTPLDTNLYTFEIVVFPYTSWDWWKTCELNSDIVYSMINHIIFKLVWYLWVYGKYFQMANLLQRAAISTFSINVYRPIWDSVLGSIKIKKLHHQWIVGLKQQEIPTESESNVSMWLINIYMRTRRIIQLLVISQTWKF